MTTSRIKVPSDAFTGTVSHWAPRGVLIRLRFCQPFFSYWTVSRKIQQSAAASLAKWPSHGRYCGWWMGPFPGPARGKPSRPRRPVWRNGRATADTAAGEWPPSRRRPGLDEDRVGEDLVRPRAPDFEPVG